MRPTSLIRNVQNTIYNIEYHKVNSNKIPLIIILPFIVLLLFSHPNPHSCQSLKQNISVKTNRKINIISNITKFVEFPHRKQFQYSCVHWKWYNWNLYLYQKWMSDSNSSSNTCVILWILKKQKILKNI